jgi:hypothetical protein
VIASNPNSADDIDHSNDTARSDFSIIGVVNGPVSASFEEVVFPPPGWAVQNPDNSNTWVKTSAAAKSGIASMVIENYAYPFGNTVDKFVSPGIVLGNPDSAFVTFDYAYRQRTQNLNSGLRLDTLELVLTTDCGLTTTSIWKKGGKSLQTQYDSVYSNSSPFIPRLPAHWKTERINILPLINPTQAFQVYFLAKSNQQNNLYIDNINISGTNLPLRLKDQGYLIYPNPFTNNFKIHHLYEQTDLQFVLIYNAAGQLVWGKKFRSNATTEVLVDLSQLATGVYVLKMIYTGKTVVGKIVKN